LHTMEITGRDDEKRKKCYIFYFLNAKNK